MRYIVIGADRETGEECKTTIEAAGKAEADKKAAGLGWLVESVQPNPEGAPVDSDLAAALDYMTPNPKPALSAPQLLLAPNYIDIQNGAAVLVIAGKLSLAAACIVPALAFLIGAAATKNVLGGFAYLVGGLFVAIPLAVNGIVLKMLAALALAHRDIARNSFQK